MLYQLIKLSIIGDSNVGKSNFLFKFIDDQFSPLHVATIGFDYKSRITTLPVSKKTVKLQIWDTAGQEKYMSINKNLFQRVQGIILMYDITKRETFEHLETWINIIKQMTNEIPIILVGNSIKKIMQKMAELLNTVKEKTSREKMTLIFLKRVLWMGLMLIKFLLLLQKKL